MSITLSSNTVPDSYAEEYHPEPMECAVCGAPYPYHDQHCEELREEGE